VAAEGLRALVAATLSARTAEPGRALARAFLDEANVDAAALRASTAVAVLLGWLVGAREHLAEPAADHAHGPDATGGAEGPSAGPPPAGPPSDGLSSAGPPSAGPPSDGLPSAGPAAVDWVRANLGADEAGQALTLAGALDHPLAPQLTMAGAVERLGDALLPALLWLVAGLTATAGAGDPDWLGRFEPTV
jgi:hypothetical protein